MPLAVVVWLLALIPTAIFLRRSVFGRYLDVIGANPRAAWASGVPYVRVVYAAHILSSLFAVLSAFLLVGFVGFGSLSIGSDLALNSLAAVILGGVTFGSGRGGVLGPAVASFMLMFIFNLLTSFRARRARKADGAGGDHRACCDRVFGARRARRVIGTRSGGHKWLRSCKARSLFRSRETMSACSFCTASPAPRRAFAISAKACTSATASPSSGPRLPGHGTSPDDMETTGYLDWVGEAEKALHELAARKRRVFVTGLSMGGSLTLNLAARFPSSRPARSRRSPRRRG